MRKQKDKTPEQHRKFLYETVIPFIKNMPADDECYIEGAATLNFNTYVSEHDRHTACEITDQYNCGRKGCLAGWYLMLSDRENRLLERERDKIDHFNVQALSTHFGIPHREASNLFSGKSPGATQHGTLSHRKGILRRFMNFIGDYA